MLSLDLSLLVEDALSVQSRGFIDTIDRATCLLQNENGIVGNLTIINRLVKLKPLGQALIIGDLHGDFESLVAILQKSQYVKKIEKTKGATLIFLGDYGDRGDKPVEIYYIILNLKLAFPKQVILLRGNHEAPKDLLGYPHDLPFQFQSRFTKDWQEAYRKTRTLFAHLYNAVLVDDRYLMVHGGLSPEIKSLHDIAQAQENHNEALLEDLLWSDPDQKEQTVSLSPRGAGKLFGKRVTEEVLRRLNVKILIRGHEPSKEGFKIDHEGKVLTLFSRKGSPYFNRFGAYLELPLSEEFENAQQLVPWIYKF